MSPPRSTCRCRREATRDSCAGGRHRAQPQPPRSHPPRHRRQDRRGPRAPWPGRATNPRTWGRDYARTARDHGHATRFRFQNRPPDASSGVVAARSSAVRMPELVTAIAPRSLSTPRSAPPSRTSSLTEGSAGDAAAVLPGRSGGRDQLGSRATMSGATSSSCARRGATVRHARTARSMSRSSMASRLARFVSASSVSASSTGCHGSIHREGSEPAAAFEDQVQAGADDRHEHQCEQVAPHPAQFGHVAEVHPVGGADQSGGEQNRRP